MKKLKTKINYIPKQVLVNTALTRLQKFFISIRDDERLFA